MTDRLAEGRSADDDLNATLDALPPEITEGGRVTLRAGPEGPEYEYTFTVEEGTAPVQDQEEPHVAFWDTTGLGPGSYRASVIVRRLYGGDEASDTADVTVRLRPTAAGETVPVSLQRSTRAATGDLAFWVAIRNSTNALSFERYQEFIDDIMCGRGGLTAGPKGQLKSLERRRALPYPDVDAYRLLKVATEFFMMTHCGVRIDRNQLGAPFQNLNLDEELSRLDGGFPSDEAGFQREIQRLWSRYMAPIENGEDLHTVPYLAAIRAKLRDEDLVAGEERFARACFGILRGKLVNPCLIELIWSYWHEEGMLVQTVNAIALRFQNQRGPLDPDPLSTLEIDPLRPLNNLLWGYVQDQEHRLTLLRRAYEYDHHYGLAMLGRAVPQLRPADSRSKFLEAFHNLLNLAHLFYRDDDDTTVIADAFPLLNALKEVHLLLTEGQHNQYGDLPWTARQEMLMQEWLLARPEMREFLPGRVMVAYPEPWMDRVDAMKRLQGWTDTSVVHFRDLGVFGERVLLSIRFGEWNDVIDANQAANWARYWRPEVQGYIHAYRAATGVDLTLEPVDATMPAVLLRQRLAEQVRQITDGRGAAMLGGLTRVQLTRRTGQLPEVRPRAQLPSRIERP